VSDQIYRLVAPPINFMFRFGVLIPPILVIITLAILFLLRPLSRRRWLVSLISAELLPILLTTAYLLLTRWPARVFTSWSDTIALAGCVVVGVICFSLSPFPAWVRVLIGALYIPVMGFLLAGYSLAFVCSAFHDCL
jgi:hypothetical protein